MTTPTHSSVNDVFFVFVVSVLDLRDLTAAVDAHTDLFRGNLQQDAQVDRLDY